MKAQTQRRLRQIHRYSGVLFAPAILFFSLSGALQTLGLHESRTGSPPAWIAWMASYHKDQVPPRPKRPRPPQVETGEGHGADMPGPDQHAGHDKKASFVALKAFVLLMALGLIASSLTGVVIALQNRATRRGSLIMLAAGVVVPVVLAVV